MILETMERRRRKWSLGDGEALASPSSSAGTPASASVSPEVEGTFPSSSSSCPQQRHYRSRARRRRRTSIFLATSPSSESSWRPLLLTVVTGWWCCCCWTMRSNNNDKTMGVDFHVPFFVRAEINETNLCSLLVFVPLTTYGTGEVDGWVAGEEHFVVGATNSSTSSSSSSGNDGASNIRPTIWTASPLTSTTAASENQNHSKATTDTATVATSRTTTPLIFGLSHMAAALIAMEQFNNRDPSVVPELGDPFFQIPPDPDVDESNASSNSTAASPIYCPIKFDVDYSRVIDSRTNGQKASEDLLAHFMEYGTPCGIVGPINHMVARRIGTVAAAGQVPSIKYGAVDLELSKDNLFPWLTQITPLFLDLSNPLATLLRDELGRSNYVALLHSLSGRVASKNFEVLELVFNRLGIQTVDAGFIHTDAELYGIDRDTDGIDEALDYLQSHGDYRTIVVITDPFEVNDTIPIIAEAADQRNMTDGRHVWSFWGGLPLWTLLNPAFRDPDTAVYRLLKGAAVVDYVDGFLVDEDDDPFLQAWRAQGPEIAEKIDYFNPPEDFFETSLPGEGASYIFDAVMSMGIGACAGYATASEASEGNADILTVTSQRHLDGIRLSQFHGATGLMKYGRASLESAEGVRKFNSVRVGAYNLYPNDNDTYILTHVITASDQPIDPNTTATFQNGTSWEPLKAFIFPNGSMEGPPDLRETPEQNYISPLARGIGLTLFAITALFCIAMIIWIIVNRSHPVLRAAQPMFLVGVCFGSLLQACCIPLNSFDEYVINSVSVLSHLCVATFWFLIIGEVIIYGSLFSKLWRVQKVLKFTKGIKVDARAVVLPSFAMFFLAFLLLAIWTALTDWGWYRSEVNELTGESIGGCGRGPEGGDLGLLWATIAAAFVPSILTLIMAWKTKDVDDSFSESGWIFALALVQFQTLIVAVPLIVILQDVDAAGRYFGYTILFWLFSTSAVGLIMVPKILAYYGVYGANTARRGARSVTKVSGVAKNKNRASTVLQDRLSGPRTETHSLPETNPPENDMP
mmetsp:Transcript_59641/g.146216  ORF Transcript_59641/g.146216 Transcript_59641/m.146216 type:complete len:1032 (+) Transcript_59641:145-3240(+)